MNSPENTLVQYTPTELALVDLVKEQETLPSVVDSIATRKEIAQYVGKCVKLRTGLAKHKKDLIADVNVMKKKINEEADRITAEIRAPEEVQRSKMTDYDREKQIEKERKQKEEDDKRNAILDKIATISDMAFCSDEDLAMVQIELVELANEDSLESFGGMRPAAVKALSDVSQKIDRRVAELAEREQREAELDQERKAFEAEKAAMAEEKEKFAAMEAELKKLKHDTFAAQCAKEEEERIAAANAVVESTALDDQFDELAERLDDLETTKERLVMAIDPGIAIAAGQIAIDPGVTTGSLRLHKSHDDAKSETIQALFSFCDQGPIATAEAIIAGNIPNVRFLQ